MNLGRAASRLPGNPLTSRADAQRLAVDLFSPLLPAFTSGWARVRISDQAANYDSVRAELEGLPARFGDSRP